MDETLEIRLGNIEKALENIAFVLAGKGQKIVQYNVSNGVMPLAQVNIENGIAGSKNKNVAKSPISHKEEIDEMPYLTEGSIGKKKRKDGRYRGKYKDANGKWKDVFGKTKQECADKIKAKIAERDEIIKHGYEIPQKNMRVHRLLDEFIIDMETSQKCSIGQLKVHKNNVRHIKLHIRNAPLNGTDILTALEIEKGLAKIVSSKTGKPSTKIQKEAYITLNMAIKYGKKKGVITKENVMENVTKTTHESESRLAFTEQMQKDILKCAKTHDDGKYYKYFLFGFYTGVRPDEFSKVKKCHINFDFKTVYIDGTKTKESKRTMPIFDQLLEIKGMLTDLADENQFFTASEDLLNDHLRRILVKIGVKNSNDYSLYSMRHTLHTRLNEMGIDTKTISKWLGNSEKIALKHYIKVMPEHERRQAEKFNAQIANF